VAMPADTAGRLAQAVDFRGSQVLPGADVGMFVALGKGERRHVELLPAELSCFRWLARTSEVSAA
jgi:hypothetical protein